MIRARFERIGAERLLIVLASATPLGAQVVISLLVSRLSGERGLGELLIAMNIVGLFGLFGDAGIGSAFLRLGRGTINAHPAEWIWSSRATAIAASTVSLLLCLVASPVLASHIGKLHPSDFAAVSAAGFFSVLSADEISVEAAAGSTSRWATRTVLRTIVTLVGLVASISLFNTSVFNGVLVGTAAGFVGTMLFFPRRVGPINIQRTAVRRILQQGWGLTIGTLFGAGSILVAPLIASTWLSLAEIGRLRAAMLLSGGLLAVASAALSSVFLPRVASLDGQDRTRLIAKAAALAGTAGAAFVVLPSLSFVMSLLNITYNAKQNHVWVLVALADGVRLVAYVLSYAAIAAGRVRSFVIREACTGAFLLTTVVVSRGGSLDGLANAYLIAAVFALCVNATATYRIMDRATRAPAVVWLCSFVAVICLETAMRTSRLLPLMSLAGVFGLGLSGRRFISDRVGTNTSASTPRIG